MPEVTDTPDRALLLVDVQNDFCPGGALPVPGGDEVVPLLNEYIRRFEDAGLPVFTSRDWHPAITQHFREAGGPWPPHCVQDTSGAAFHPDLRIPPEAEVITKGTSTEDHGYSAFDGVDDQGRPFAETLRANGIRELFVAGLATDYCVLNTVVDALDNGFDVALLLDGIRGIDVTPGDVAHALDRMKAAGARTATLATIDTELE